MDRDQEMFTALLLDPFLTTDEATREAAAFAAGKRFNAALSATAEPHKAQAFRGFRMPHVAGAETAV